MRRSRSWRSKLSELAILRLVRMGIGAARTISAADPLLVAPEGDSAMSRRFILSVLKVVRLARWQVCD